MLAGQRAPFVDPDIGWIPIESMESWDKYGAIRGRSGFSVSLIGSIAKNRIEVCAGVIRISKVDVLGQISVRQDFRRFEVPLASSFACVLQKHGIHEEHNLESYASTIFWVRADSHRKPRFMSGLPV